MNELLARAGSFFVAPAARPVEHALTPPVACAGVLAPSRDLAPAAGAIAARLRRGARTGARTGGRTGTALVCTDRPPVPLPATPSARALARRLCARDLAAAATGTLCHVALPDDPAEFVRHAWRILAFAEVPVVVALGRRDEVHDELLAALDLLVLATSADTDPALTDLAAASLQRLGPPVTTVATSQ